MTLRPDSVVVEDTVNDAESLGSIPGSAKLDTVSPTIRHRCDVSSELHCPGSNPLDGPRHSLHALGHYHEYSEDLIILK